MIKAFRGRLLARSWSIVGAIWAHLKPAWAMLGAILGSTQMGIMIPIFVRLVGDASWHDHGPSWEPVGLISHVSCYTRSLGTAFGCLGLPKSPQAYAYNTCAGRDLLYAFPWECFWVSWLPKRSASLRVSHPCGPRLVIRVPLGLHLGVLGSQKGSPCLRV